MSHLGNVIEEAIKTALRAARVALPGRIVTYDTDSQAAEVEIQLQIPLNKLNGRNEVLRGQHAYEELPKLHGVKVGHPAGGGYSIHFPMVAGNFVWVMFSDQSLDEFTKTGKVSKPVDTRSHDLFPYALPANDPSSPLSVPAPDAAKLVIASTGGDGTVKVDGDLEVTGDIDCTGEVTAKAGTASSVGLTTHLTPSPMGPLGPPTPGT